MALARPCYARFRGDGIVFRRHTYEWILPSGLGPHLRYDPKKLPVVQTAVDIREDSVEVWEFTAEKLGYDRRVFACARCNEDHYLRLAVARINDGYRCGTTIERVSFV
jgi:hypothetical protein